MERPSTTDPQDNRERAREELSVRFTERLDPEIPDEIGGKLKGLVNGRRASRSVKSSRDKWRRSSYSLEDGVRPGLHSDQPVAVETDHDSRDVKKPSTEGVVLRESLSSVSESAVPQLESMSDQLPYYLTNFMMILDTVLSCEDRVLFDDDDMKVVNTFKQLPLASQKLYIRLLHRKYRWLSVHKIQYPEIGEDLTEQVIELITAGLLESGDNIKDLQVILSLLSAPNLRQIVKSLHVSMPNGISDARSKQQLIYALMENSTKQRSLLSFTNSGKSPKCSTTMTSVIRKKAETLLGHVFRIDKDRQSVFERVLILFSMTTSLEEDGESTAGKSEIYNLLQVNVGSVVYAPYTIDRPSLLIATRQELLSYEQALHKEQEFLACMEKGNLYDAEAVYVTCRALFESCIESKESSDLHLPDFLHCFSPGWVYTRMMSLAVEMLQRLRDYEGAVDLLERLLEQKVYCKSRRGYWWDRLALNLHQHLKETEKALSIITCGILDDHVRTGHHLSLVERARKICLSPNHSEFRCQLSKFPLPYEHEPKEVEIKGIIIPDRETGRKTMFVSSNQTSDTKDPHVVLSSVEELALSHYCHNEGWERGLHAEGSSFSALFCLLMWDVIFASGIPNVFRTKYQTCPLDFSTDHFYESRKAMVDDRLTEINGASSEDLCGMIATTWTAHFGQLCVGMNWDLFPSQLKDAQDLAVCMGGSLTATVCSRLAKDYSHCRGGVPDLTLWSPSKQTCKFVEVKGPGDRLSPKQVLWLDFLTAAGADAEVCKVKAFGG
jgi:Fanconi-associated nuclease 1